MTASKLEESIEKFAAYLRGDGGDAATVIRAFAEAVWECNCACNKKQEPKECGCNACASSNYFGKGNSPRCEANSPAALPDEVKENIDWICWLHTGPAKETASLEQRITELCRLCLSLRKGTK